MFQVDATFNKMISRHQWLLMAVISLLPGCAAFHPIRGVPASYVSDEFLSESREGRRQIDPSLLVRARPDQHLVAGGDVLSIYVPRVLGSLSSEVAEVGISPPINIPASPDDPPTVGFPIQVRDDDTISLPQIPPLNVKGMTLYEVEAAIRKAYTVDHHILKPEEAMVLVSLFRPRDVRVLIFRQEFGQLATQPQSGQGSLNPGNTPKGTARQVRLKLGENDVAHALTLAGVDGLPGNNAENTIYIIRNRKNRPQAQQVAPTETLSPAPTTTIPSGVMPLQPEPSSGFLPARPIDRPNPYGNIDDSARPVDQTAYGSIDRLEPPADRLNPHGYITRMSAEHMQTTGGVLTADYIEPGEAAATNVQLVDHSGSPQAWGSKYLHQSSTDQLTPVVGPATDVEQVQQLLAPYMPSGNNQGFVGQPTTLPPVAMPVPGMIPQPTPIASPGSLPADDAYSTLWGQYLNEFDLTIDNPNVVKIPVRVQPGDNINFTEADITLHDGDIVFIETRQTEVFYTGGLLGGGQYVVPRDYDLHVLEAISIAESRSQQGGATSRAIGGVSALNQDVANSASRLLVIRKLPNGQRTRIEVNIYKAMVRDEENILIKPGDMLILQYTFPEACAAFTQRFLLEGALIGIATSTFTGGGGGGGGGQ